MLFQKNIIKKYLATLPLEDISQAWDQYKSYFLNPAIQQNILRSKEEQFQEGFLRELFVKILGYTLNPSPDYNLITEQKNEANSKKADGAILLDGKVIGIIELKDHKTTDLAKIEAQAFGYKSQHRDARYVIISNFEKLRLYIDNAVDFREWNLFAMTEDEFNELYLCIAWTQVNKGVALKLKSESVSSEDQITQQLYKDYSAFKREIFADIVANNTDENTPKEHILLLFKKTQKLLDRLLFIFFAEDCGLLPPNMMLQVINEWKQLKELDVVIPLYTRIMQYFGYLYTGKEEKGIFSYNGGLFKPDEILDELKISDELLARFTRKLSEYDYASEVDVNILGHIFENSLNEIEEVTAQINSGEKAPAVSKRKRDGVFYTPQYITKYIVENTVGRLCAEKKSEMGIDEAEYFADKNRQMATKKRLMEKLQAYREWLLGITICDPACGSGAFLNAALAFLINEHKLIDEMETKVTGGSIVFQNVENSILENNLYGVDINEESVEIAKLALWLRTAKPHRKLNSLNNNIKCGNSLISDPSIAGEKAFDWETEFPQVFEKGGFDVVIGNPPYVDSETMTRTIPEQRDYITRNYQCAKGNYDLFIPFIEKAIKLSKDSGLVSLIVPNKLIAAKYGIELRKFISTKNLYELIDYSDVNVFEDASVYPCIVVLQNTKCDTNTKMTRMSAPDIAAYENIVAQSKLNKGICWDTYFFEPTTVAIIEKVNKFNKLETYFPNVNGAATVNEAYSVKEKIFDKIDSSESRKFINTGTIDRYSCLWGYSKTQYIKGQYLYPRIKDNDIKEISQNRYLQSISPKIIVAGMCLNYEAFYDEGCFLAGKSTTIILGEKTDLKCALAIINSKLISFWLAKSFNSLTMAGGYFNVGTNELSSIPYARPINQQPFIDLADTMLSLNAQLQQKRSRFLRRLQDNLPEVKITGTLETFDTLQFADFVKELKKQKIKLTLPQQDEWEDYFSQYKTECQSLKTQIATTDKEIDKKVYELYGLTEEEIEVVEGK